jgi:hypothetical protein
MDKYAGAVVVIEKKTGTGSFHIKETNRWVFNIEDIHRNATDKEKSEYDAKHNLYSFPKEAHKLGDMVKVSMTDIVSALTKVYTKKSILVEEKDLSLEEYLKTI